MTIDKEDFEQWRAHPITEAVNRALKKLADRNKTQWISVSWDSGQVDPLVRADLKARADAAQDLSELTVEELNEVLNDEEGK